MESQSALATRLLETRDLPSPILIEIINHLTFAEFYEIYAKAKPDSTFALDNSELVEFLLAGNDDGKKLVVASFSGGGSFREGIKAETAVKLANVSRAHKIALLSNVRLDWYSLRLFERDATVRTELLAATMLSDNRDEKLALLRNPRMDRRFVADIIRGKNEFHAIPARERFWYGLEAIKVKEIGSENYPGKDMPDSNEMNFHKPEEALLAALREVLADTSIELSPFYLDQIMRLYYRDHLLFSLDDEDWLSEDQKREAERISDWHRRYESRKRMALINFINWVSRWSVNEPEIPTGTDKIYGYGAEQETGAFEQKHAKGTLAAMLSLQAFRKLDDDKEIKKGMRSRNWCVRAGAFAMKYASLESRGFVGHYVASWMFFTRYAKDPYALVRGLALSRKFWNHYGGYPGIVKSRMESFAGKYGIKINNETMWYLASHVQEMVYPEHKDDDAFAGNSQEHLTTSKSAPVIGYVWRVLVNVFYVAVVLYVFDKLQGHSEAIITVSVLGLIYVTIRSIAISQGMGLASALKVIESDIIRLRELVHDEQARQRLASSKADSEVLSRERNKLAIDGFFLFIVSIICLLALFGELGK
jgi:hypothetical protein